MHEDRREEAPQDGLFKLQGEGGWYKTHLHKHAEVGGSTPLQSGGIVCSQFAASLDPDAQRSAVTGFPECFVQKTLLRSVPTSTLVVLGHVMCAGELRNLVDGYLK